MTNIIRCRWGVAQNQHDGSEYKVHGGTANDGKGAGTNTFRMGGQDRERRHTLRSRLPMRAIPKIPAEHRYPERILTRGGLGGITVSCHAGAGDSDRQKSGWRAGKFGELAGPPLATK